MRTYHIKYLALTIFVLGASLGCAVTFRPLSKSNQTTPTEAAVNPALVKPTAEPPASPSSPGSPDSLPALDTCDKDICYFDGTFFLTAPVGAESRNTVDTASRFGTPRKNTDTAYHGVQFLNSKGTPVLAVMGGEVVVAGNDQEIIYGDRANQYGNVVILKHDLNGVPEPVYTVYSFLSKINVKAGDKVKAGDQVGLVGSSGSVLGSTLGFEMRYGENTYDSTVNPELWLQLLKDQRTGEKFGALAGRVVDGNGNYVGVSNIPIENLSLTIPGKLRPFYLRTYLDGDLTRSSPWKENFAAANLPAGNYKISIWRDGQMYQREVEIQPGKMTYVTIEVQ
jgi:hypothetical protein